MFLARVLAILLIIGGIELNPGPKRQTTLTPAISPATHESADSDLKVLILNLSTEMKGMRERLDSGLVQIERRLEEWDKRAQEMELKITQSMEAQCNTDKRVDGNTLQLRELEARMEYTEARLREQNLIFYGIVREENEYPFDCNRKVKSIITDKMGFTDEVKITKCHRLSRAENSPVLAVIPDHEERARVLSNAIKLKGSKYLSVKTIASKISSTFPLVDYLKKFNIFALTETWTDHYVGYKLNGFQLIESKASRNHKLGRSSGGIIVGIGNTIKDLLECIEAKISEGYEVVLAGDLNTRTGTQGYLHNPLMLPTSLNASRNSKDEVISPNAVQFINFLEDNLLVIINGRTKSDENGEYTYISERGSSVVDYCIVTHTLLEHRINLLINPLPYSDHMPMVIKMDSNFDGIKLESSTPRTFKKYKWASEKETTFIQNLVAIQGSWNSPIEMLTNNFTNQIRSAMHTAGMQVVITPDGPKSKPWFDRECYLTKKALKSQLKIYIRSNSESDRKAYALLKKKYSSLLAGKKKTYYIEIQERLKEFYTELLTTSPPVKYDLSIRVILMPDDELMAEISLSEISEEIARLKRNKACGLDSIPNEAIKALPPAYLAALKDIYNRVLKTGHFPTTWCKTIIHPIFKNGDADNPHNYWGIALLSNLAKLFSSIMKIRLSNWTENRAIIPENQAGFRKEHSCQDHIFTLVSLIQLTLRRKRRKFYAFFIDLKKAFDSVPQALLWKKLLDIGLNFRFINLIKNYYEKITAAVRWNNSFTEFIKIKSGVLQGEPLSPYLFILFINDLISTFDSSDLPGIYLPKHGNIHLLLYADDIVLIGESKNNLQLKINMVRKYFEENMLTLNENKSKIMVFRNGGKRSKSDNWFWGQQLLNVTEGYMYLGYPLTSTNSFKQAALYYKGKLSLAVVRIELGRVSLSVTVLKLTLKFWLRMLGMGETRLSLLCLSQLLEISNATKKCIGFTGSIVNTLNTTGFQWLNFCTDYRTLQREIPHIIRTAIDQSLQKDLTRITNSRLYPHYKNICSTPLPEHYLSSDFPLRVKRCIAGLRILSVLFTDERPKIFKTDGWTCEICGTRMVPGLHHHILSCMGLKVEREVLLSEIGLEGFSLEFLLNEVKRQRAKMEEQARQSSETTKQSSPTTQPKIPQIKPVRSSSPSALQRNHPDDMPPSPNRIHKLLQALHGTPSTSSGQQPKTKFKPYTYSPIVLASRRKLLASETVETYFKEKMDLLNQTSLKREEKIQLTDGLPLSWRDVFAAAQPADPTKWIQVALSVEHNRQQNYRELNKITIDDKQPLPLLQDIFDRLHGAKYFTTLDVAWGYWHVQMHPESVPKTAFVTDDGHYECLVMPFGLKNAASTFQKIIQQVIGTLLWKGHMNLIKQVFEKLLEYNIKLKLNKCSFAQSEVKYLGHIIGHNKVKPDPDKIKAVQDFPQPTTVKGIRRFIGLANFYQKFIPRFAEIATPLTNLTQKNKLFSWTPQVDKSFIELKAALTSEPILTTYNPEVPCKLYTDASAIGIAGILSQEIDSTEHVISYYSKKLLKHQQNYSAYELECYAVIQAIDYFEVYLENKPFQVITDHSALQWLLNLKNPKSKFFSWLVNLSTKTFTITHRSGNKLTHVDALSRAPGLSISIFELQQHQRQADLSFIGDPQDHQNTVMVKKIGLLRAVVPASFKEHILKEYHDNMSHPSMNKTVKLIVPLFWWSDMVQEIKSYVRSCRTCQLTKLSNQPTLGQLIIPDTELQPAQVISAYTIVMGTSAEKTKHKYIQVFIDHLTRYVWAFPTIKNTAQATLQCFNRILQVSLPIKHIITDNGKNFNSKEFKRCLKVHSIKQTFTTPYHPQSNGMCEKVNGTIMTKLRAALLDKPKVKWSTLLPKVITDYNNTPHDVTGFPPSFLLFGYNVQPQFADNPSTSVEDARKLAIKRTQHHRDISKRRHDSRHPDIDFKVGDLVLKRIPYNDPRLIKTAPKYEGPFQVLRRLSKVTYELSTTDQDNPPRNPTGDPIKAHISQLKSFILRV
ncbi:hypothetical protein LAZ67_8002154 [Cordylochernes scorpioides]|uniref:RNA-directed DNA polymerase n=1 Tax=Cordylochernes scorpioides TaxID=51811 RepID=A0ABY6KQR3_9ARAC|nr:hypothetical protein LAZ67_8002154 [Cordylochernes scorpioides]